MSRNLSGFERGLAIGVFALSGFVGVMVLSSDRGPPKARALSGADSIQIATQYLNRLAWRGRAYSPPKWLAHVHIARLQEVATWEINGEDTPPISQDSVAAVLSEVSGSYLGSMLTDDDGIVSRWPASERPIRVWVQPYSNEAGFTTELVGPARRGFTAWNELGLPVHFELVDDSTLAAVHVTWSAVMQKQEQVGVTFRTTTSPGYIALAHVILSTARDIYTVQNAARHEAGHVLGLGHSTDMSDIMAGATEGRQYRITDADMRTVRLLYRLPAGLLQR
ncbi:MAG TPA: matrixin family metalloprotease [Gemmatimonadaceae bacterium]|nr:matrixin family metalloprotease [Gemmatimonadaceae bacterium]